MTERIDAFPAEDIAKLKAEEAKRKELDPSYMTLEEAAEIPASMQGEPAIAARIAASRQHWPEEHMSLSQIVKAGGQTLPGGEGEQTEARDVDMQAEFETRSGKVVEE